MHTSKHNICTSLTNTAKLIQQHQDYGHNDWNDKQTFRLENNNMLIICEFDRLIQTVKHIVLSMTFDLIQDSVA